MSDKSENKESKNLDDILDSALEDFQNIHSEAEEKSVSNEVDDDINLWNDEFFKEQAKLLNSKMNAALNTSTSNEDFTVGQISAGFQKMAEAANIALQNNLSTDDNSAKCIESITEALQGLKEGINKLQAPVSEADIANMFTSLNLQEGEASDSNVFLPLMHGMIQSLLSAEILLPSIKELLNKYPKYLEENSNEISVSDKERYLKQQELFKVICNELEEEKPNDSEEVKQERFKRVLNHMQKLHEYGQPPADLIGDVEDGIAAFSTQNQDQCNLM